MFTLSATQLQSAPTIRLRVPFGSSTLINVTGDSYSTATQPYYSMEIWNGTSYSQYGNEGVPPEVEQVRRALLWNFPEATDIQIGPNLAWQGSVLAPGAAIVFPGSTQLNGTVVAGSLTGDGESHLHPPDEICLPDSGSRPRADPHAHARPVAGADPHARPDAGTTPTPTPTPVPPPIPTPIPPPDPSPPPEPLVPDDTPDEGGVLPDAVDRTNFNMFKQVLNRRGRPVDLLRTRPGRLVRFRLFGENFGFATARDVVACDRIPRGLRLVRAPGDPTVRRRAHLLAPGKRRHKPPRHDHVPRPPARLRARRQPAHRPQRQRRSRPRQRARERLPPNPPAADRLELAPFPCRSGSSIRP